MQPMIIYRPTEQKRQEAAAKAPARLARAQEEIAQEIKKGMNPNAAQTAILRKYFPIPH